MEENNYWLRAFATPLKRLGRILLIAALAGILPAILIFIFGFFIKTSSEYRCVLHIVGENKQILAVTGAPVSPGLFAWTSYYESGGMLTQGTFSTYVSGPKGGGTIDANFYRAPIGATLWIGFSTKNEEIDIYDGEYPCDD